MLSVLCELMLVAQLVLALGPVFFDIPGVAGGKVC